MAGFMAVWLSGFVFLFCCQEMKAVAADESCPLVKAGSHCDKAQQTSTNDAIEALRPACFDCCGFLPIVFDKSRKVDTVQKQIATPADNLAVAKFEFAGMPRTMTSSPALADRVPDRRGTYLVNKVFRI